MEVQRVPRYPLHGRVQVALPNQSILSGHTLDISVAGLCILLFDQIPLGGVYTIRFEMTIKGQIHVITASVKSIYGVFTSTGFRAGLAFREDDSHRTELINSLAGKRPMVDSESKQKDVLHSM